MVPFGRVMVCFIMVSFWPLTMRVWWLFDEPGPGDVVPAAVAVDDGDMMECGNNNNVSLVLLFLFLVVVGRRDVTTDDDVEGGASSSYDSVVANGGEKEEVVFVVIDRGEASSYDCLTNAGDNEEVDDILGDIVCVSMRPSGYSVVISFLPLTILVLVLGLGLEASLLEEGRGDMGGV